MNTQPHDESGRAAVIGGPHGNPTKRHALAMATELAERERRVETAQRERERDRDGERERERWRWREREREMEMVMVVVEPGNWLAGGDIL